MTDEERNEERSGERSPTERAEEFLDRAGQTAGFFAANVGWRVARFAARAREEAEDMLAEAQYVREGIAPRHRRVRGEGHFRDR